MIARHLLITGTVQGVWYRDSMRREAEALGVSGWVRNRRDGSVEAFIQGEAEAVARLIDWAHRGPPAARVAAVAVREAQVELARSGFAIHPTA